MITLWPSLTDTVGEHILVPWEELPDTLLVLGREYPEALWSPAAFRGPRSQGNLIHRTAITLDHDSATIPLPEALDSLAGKGLECFGHKTKTYGRWRIIVRTPEPLPGDLYQVRALELAELFGCARESATPAQPWFLPRFPIEYPATPLERALQDEYVRAAISHDGDAWFEWPRNAKGLIDRSSVDMILVHRLLSHGCSRDDIAEILRARGDLTKNHSDKAIDRMIDKAQAPRPGVRAGLPVILVSHDLGAMVRESVQALSQDPSLYVRSGALSHVIGLPSGAPEVAMGLAPDSPVVREIGEPNLTKRLSEVADFRKVNKEGEEISTSPPPRVSLMVLGEHQWPGVRILKGVTESPLVRPDGSLFQGPGHDPLTGFLMAGPPVKLLEAPTRGDAIEALAALREVYCDFTWSEPAMGDVAIAAIVALVCRPAVGANVPLFAFDAPGKGSGKTLIADTISLIATGRTTSRAVFPKDPTELGKRLDAFARAGAPLIAFDNADTAIMGAALDALLTCEGSYTFRLLGETTNAVCSVTSVVMVTGNQLRVAGDTSRRTLLARMVPEVENPAERTDFTHYPLKPWVVANRGRLLSAAITILRAYLLDGAPSQGLGSRGSFEDFVSRVAGAIVWAGGHNILDTWALDSGNEDDRDHLATMIQWLALRWPNGATAREIASEGEALMPGPEYSKALAECPGARAMFSEIKSQGAGTLAQSLALRLRDWRDKRLAGFQLVQDKASNKWSVKCP